MLTIIDKIKLKKPEYVDDFIQWVKEVDYIACHELPSVLSFQMHEVKQGGDCDFLEIIQVSAWKDFEKDMSTPIFSTLVERFSKMAEVTEQIICDPIPPGYQKQS